MKKLPLVSVIIPVYNVVDYLDNCIKSVINQSYTNLEIIIVDDGSTDGSDKKCDEWAQKDTRIKVMHQKNSGVSIARNLGISNAKGDYLSFLDSDDRYTEMYIEKMVREALDTEADIICCDYASYGKTEELKNSDKVQYNTDEAISHLLDYNGYKCFVWNKLFSMRCIKGVRFPENWWFEDIVFCYDTFSSANKIVYLKEKLYEYREENGYSSKFKFSNKNYDLIKSLDYVLDGVKSNYSNIYIDVLMGFIVGYMSFLNRGYINNGDVAEYENRIRNIIQSNIYNVLKTKAIPQNRKLWYLIYGFTPKIYIIFVKIVSKFQRG